MLFRRKKAGFTLTEMVMVLAVMTVLLSISVAAFNSMLQSTGVEGSVRAIAGALSSARIKAMNDRREVNCGISVDGAIDYGFCFIYGDYNHKMQTRVMTRMMRRGETLSDIIPILKEWEADTYRPLVGSGTKTYFYGFIVGGKGSGHNTVQITGNSKSVLKMLTPGWEEAPATNSLVCILKETGDEKPDAAKLRYMISSDMLSGNWELLPESVDVDGTYFPITFAPDGGATFPYDHAVIRLRDLRSAGRTENNELRWEWRIVVARGSGRCTTSRIMPGDIDELCERDY